MSELTGRIAEAWSPASRLAALEARRRKGHIDIHTLGPERPPGTFGNFPHPGAGYLSDPVVHIRDSITKTAASMSDEDLARVPHEELSSAAGIVARGNLPEHKEQHRRIKAAHAISRRNRVYRAGLAA